MTARYTTATVRRALELYESGLSCRAVAARLAKDMSPSPSQQWVFERSMVDARTAPPPSQWLPREGRAGAEGVRESALAAVALVPMPGAATLAVALRDYYRGLAARYHVGKDKVDEWVERMVADALERITAAATSAHSLTPIDDGEPDQAGPGPELLGQLSAGLQELRCAVEELRDAEDAEE